MQCCNVTRKGWEQCTLTTFILAWHKVMLYRNAYDKDKSGDHLTQEIMLKNTYIV